MNFGFCGILDIVIIVGAIIAIVVGFKKGFMNKMLSLVGVFAILIFAIFYCTQLSQFLIKNNVIYPGIYDKMQANVTTKLDAAGVGASAMEIIKAATGLPEFLCKLIANSMGNPQTADIVKEVCTFAATWVMNIISFFILFFGSLIILAILKLIAKMVRTLLLVRIIDGILGGILTGAIFLVIVTALFSILHIVMDQAWFEGAKTWLSVDMQLGNEEAFRISKTLYEQNFFVRIYNLFF